MANKEDKRKLTQDEKKSIKSAIEAVAVDCTPDKDWLVIVRVGTDSFPANREDMRVTLAHIDRLKKNGYIPDDMRVVVVPHTLQFTREELSEIEVMSVES